MRVSGCDTVRQHVCTRCVELWRYLRDELHVLRSAHVLAKVDGVEAEGFLVLLVVGVAAREVILLGTAGAGDLPRKQTIGDANNLVALGTVAIAARERQHRVVLALGVVLERQALVKGISDIDRSRRAAERAAPGLAEEARIATRDVAGAHDVAHHVHVLRLGDDRLGVA